MSSNVNDFPHNWFLALRNGELEKLKQIAMNECVEVNDLFDMNGNLSLINAAVNQEYAICEYLVEELGASIFARDKIGRTALIEMVRCRSSKWNKKFVSLFRASVNEKDRSGRTALMFASIGAGLFGSKRGNIRIVNQLLEAGADIKAKDNNGYTALGHAQLSNKQSKTQNNQEVVNLLMREYLSSVALEKFKENYNYNFSKKGAIQLSELCPCQDA